MGCATNLKTQTHFNEFIQKYNKKYESTEHYHERLTIFAENLEMIEKHNSEGHSWKMAVNHFADLTHEEFKSTYASGLLNIAKPHGLAAPKATKKINLKDLPESKDWRDE